MGSRSSNDTSASYFGSAERSPTAELPTVPVNCGRGRAGQGQFETSRLVVSVQTRLFLQTCLPRLGVLGYAFEEMVTVILCGMIRLQNKAPQGILCRGRYPTV
jgi:hypothetical protein